MSKIQQNTLTNEEIKDAHNKFYNQQWRAINYRNIGWNMSFEEWMQWWFDTGHWYDRGTCKGQYAMCRYSDTGPYALDNIYCDLQSNNSSFAKKGNTYNKGKTSWRKNTSRKSNKCEINKVVYESQVSAASQLNISRTTLRNRLNSEEFLTYIRL